MYLGDPSKSLVDGSEAGRNVYKGDHGGPDLQELYAQRQAALGKSQKAKPQKQKSQPVPAPSSLDLNQIFGQLFEQSFFLQNGPPAQSNTLLPVDPSAVQNAANPQPLNAFILLRSLATLLGQLLGLQG